ncbi:hypothetical protein F2S72_09465 [Pseudomonas syringae pv. actinidiae]|nr:hypothetical protein [Pseudomonas syringae pv. actinidiae]
MTQFPISVSVTTVTHSWMEHLKDEWRPSGATVSTNEQTLSAIRAARDVAKSNGFAGAVPALSPEDFELGFTTCTDDPVLVSARFFTVTVTCQSMRIELFDPLMELKNGIDRERLPAYVRIECNLNGLL